VDIAAGISELGEVTSALPCILLTWLALVKVSCFICRNLKFRTQELLFNFCALPCVTNWYPSNMFPTWKKLDRLHPLTFRYDFERLLYTFRATEKKRFIIKFVIVQRVVWYVPTLQRGLLIMIGWWSDWEEKLRRLQTYQSLKHPQEAKFHYKDGAEHSPKRRNVMLVFKNP